MLFLFGSAMLADDAFLRRLPRAIPLELRLRQQAMVTAADLVEVAYDHIKLLLVEVVDIQGQGIPHRLVLRLALHAWAMVDSTHTFLEFARRENRTVGGSLDSFIGRNEVATLMRNAMDHQAAQVGNAARVKGGVHPIYGFVDFLTPRNDSGDWRRHFIPLGAMHHPVHDWPTFETTSPTNEPISGVRLTAFGQQVNLSDLDRQLRSQISRMNEEAERTVPPQIRAECERQGLEFEEVMADRVQGQIHMVAEMGPL